MERKGILLLRLLLLLFGFHAACLAAWERPPSDEKAYETISPAPSTSAPEGSSLRRIIGPPTPQAPPEINVPPPLKPVPSLRGSLPGPPAPRHNLGKTLPVCTPKIPGCPP